MNMTRTIGATIALAAAIAGAGCGEGASDPTAPPTAAEPQGPENEAIVHASLSLGGDHVLEFIEVKAGLVGVVEKGRTLVDTPQLTADVTSLPWLDMYRHFAGASARIPVGMIDADRRLSARAIASEVSTTAAPAPSVPRDLDRASTGAGPHFYNDAEQAWFKSTFCTEKYTDCIQGWWFTSITSARRIGKATAYSWVGSESTVVANFRFYDPVGYPTDPCSGWSCQWQQWYNLIVSPGHYAGTTFIGAPQYYKWDLTGSERNTQVSTMTYY
jgi:hypothetical protein